MTVALASDVARAGPQGAAVMEGSASFSSTEDRILGAALRLVGRRGVKRLGMQEVSEAAGVERPGAFPTASSNRTTFPSIRRRW